MTRVINSSSVKLVVYVPLTHADQVREAVGLAGAGAIGNYTNCSFSIRGQGRFIPQQGANPFLGNVGVTEIVDEDRIEITVLIDKLPDVLTAMKAVHPYEEIAYDLYPLYETASS
jgi:hypothetical protein